VSQGLWFISNVIELTRGMRKEEEVKNVAYNFEKFILTPLSQ